MRDRSATDHPRTGEPLTRVLTRAVRTVTARIEQVLKAEGLSLDQWLVLDALAGERGLAMAELATRTLATGPTLTRVVDRLVTTAAVYREVDPDDRRRVRVYLSPRGRAAHKRIAAKVGEVEAGLLARADQPAAVLAFLERLAD
ncbi:MarR family winged helix-turn-helix transcriptional regulator [Amycolatopsis anabasis]|uniref:MarR family winged helix-turn-helix transcriptional regulator n=1 Tax=Amycolatopsis anabasis TaxID=1840409 RepID=UPI00131B4C1D|nr:MarR family transcriptional regulator [Amycolatopsis anabasis]